MLRLQAEILRCAVVGDPVSRDRWLYLAELFEGGDSFLGFATLIRDSPRGWLAVLSSMSWASVAERFTALVMPALEVRMPLPEPSVRNLEVSRMHRDPVINEKGLTPRMPKQDEVFTRRLHTLVVYR